MISKMIPALWLRIVVLIVFIGYTMYNEMTLMAFMCAGLMILTSVQLVQAYRQR